MLNLFTGLLLSLSNLVLVCPFLNAQLFLSIRLAQTKRLFVKLIFDFFKFYVKILKFSSRVSKLLTFSVKLLRADIILFNLSFSFALIVLV